MNATLQQGLSVFERAFGRSSNSFKTVSEVDEFVKANRAPLSVSTNKLFQNNFVIPQGNIFSIPSDSIDGLLDRALKEQSKCHKRSR